MGGFEDLLPAELAASKRSGPMPMRPAPPPPALRPTGAAVVAATAPPAPPPVDGVPESMVDAWFRHADADGDGRVADAEARSFFLTSGLAAADLSKIWKLVKSPEVIAREGKGLTRHRFAQVLRLVALAQSGYAFSEENATAALHSHTWLALHGVPLPPPRIGVELSQQAAATAAGAPAASPAGGVGASSSSNPFAANSSGAGAAAGEPQQAGPTLITRQQGAASGGLQPGAAPPAAAPASGTSFFAGDEFQLGSAAGLPLPAAAGAATTAAAAADDDDDLFGLRTLRQQQPAAASALRSSGSSRAAPPEAAVPAAAGAHYDGDGDGTAVPKSPGGTPPLASCNSHLSRSMAMSGAGGSGRGGTQRAASDTLEPPVAFNARLPPLQPKVSAKLTMLAAGNGSLFAGPAIGGGLLQWAGPEGLLRQPADAEGQQVGTEDPDASPAIEVSISDKGRTATCLLVDEPAQLLWVADKEGWVYAFSLEGKPGMLLRPAHRAYQFQAHRVGYVTAMCRTPQGHLWTGSSRGSLRLWELGEPALLGDAPEPPRCRELRKGFGERAHTSPVLWIVCPADGQLVWSASVKGVLLWDAACGACLGGMLRMVGRMLSQASQADLAASMGSSTGSPVDAVVLKYKIDSSKGLEVDPITGYVTARPPSSDWGRIAADQEAWAAQSDNNINELMERVSIGGSKVVQGAGKTLKLLGKLARGLGGSGAAPAAAADSLKTTARQGSTSGPTVSSALAAAQGADEEGAGPLSGASAMDNQLGSIVALVTPPDGSVWVAHKCGTVDRYTAAGRRCSTEECGGSITAMACVGQRVWVGFADGVISVRDQDGATLRSFHAHDAGILSIAQAGTRTYSLAADGSIKGWSSAVPQPADLEALYSWDEQACQTYRRETLRVLCVTWNVGESKPEPGSAFFRWVHEAAFNTQLAVVGLQEIEMGSSSVALAAAKDAFSQKLQERGNTNAKFWSTNVLAALGGERHWHQVGLRQLSGMLILVYARNHLRDCIGEVSTASVACGVLGVGGNKGAVAVEFSVHRRKIAVVCSHFAAHQGAVEARNANYATISRQLTFSRRAWFADEEEAVAVAGQGLASSLRKSTANATALALEEAAAADVDSDAESSVGPDSSAVPPTPGSTTATNASVAAVEEVVQGESMRAAQMLVWLGDFNYRIDGGYESVKERAIRNELGPLLQLDQCRREMAAGRLFRGLREGAITFRPTYKFDKASANPFGYDTSEKRRIPAWCDRIFFRGSVPFPTPEPEEGEGPLVVDEEEDVVVAPLEYNCWSDVTDSDHKPVYAVLEANLPITDQDKKRGICSDLLEQCAAAALDGHGSDGAAGATGPTCTLAPQHVKLAPGDLPRQMALLTNKSQQPLLFTVSQEAVPAGAGSSKAAAAAAAAQLLEVRPVRGVLEPGQDQQILVHLSGDEWALRGATVPPELTFKVHVTHQYGAGGEHTGPGCTTLKLRATCLTH